MASRSGSPRTPAHPGRDPSPVPGTGSLPLHRLVNHFPAKPFTNRSIRSNPFSMLARLVA